MDSSVFNDYSRYYDLLYKDKDYIKEAHYMKGLLSDNNIQKGELLEFGAGTGKHGNLLAEMGFRVHGVEQSYEMVKLASISENFSCQQGDVCEIRLGRKFDAVLSFFHVFSYQITDEKVLAFLTTASLHLNSGGILIFDFWYAPSVLYHTPEVRVKVMADNELEITRIAEPTIYYDRNVVDVNYTIFSNKLSDGIFNKVKETHTMRYFSLPEIDFFAQQTGFERIKTEEFLSGNDASVDTWGVCVVLRKI